MSVPVYPGTLSNLSNDTSNTSNTFSNNVNDTFSATAHSSKQEHAGTEWPCYECSLTLADDSGPHCLWTLFTMDPPAYVSRILRMTLTAMYTDPKSCPTAFRTISVTLKQFDGVAYCCQGPRGKEIYLSWGYLHSCFVWMQGNKTKLGYR